MPSHLLLATASMVLALALAPRALADQPARTPPGQAGHAGHAHPPPAPPSDRPAVVPRGDLRGDIASNARIHGAPPPRSSGVLPRR
ncbi:hypothetical protein [Burkholderia gladioli]|jgi:hypothetical protein|uniref:hypothetical protein n=1 Tax=Burkholderia gladioli TaxID=28095 RepID=UPI001FC8668B|nr:hypothetical protein [Burkholderia gladioli]